MIQQYTGIPSDFFIIGLAVLVIVLLVLYIINLVQIIKLKKNYGKFMKGKNAKSLEDTLISRLTQLDELEEESKDNGRNIKTLFKKMEGAFQKYGIVKYDAFDEMGGKLSFSIALLDENDNGYVQNVVHSREGCYSYVKEIIDGNSVVNLAEEEEEALKKALKL